MPPLDVHVLHPHPDVISQLKALAVAAAQEALAKGCGYKKYLFDCLSVQPPPP